MTSERGTNERPKVFITLPSVGQIEITDYNVDINVGYTRNETYTVSEIAACFMRANSEARAEIERFREAAAWGHSY